MAHLRRAIWMVETKQKTLIAACDECHFRERLDELYIFISK